MSNIYFLIVIALIAGAVLPLQIAVNAKLSDAVGSPPIGALISFAVGTISLLVYCIITGAPLASLAAARSAPPIAWVGGICGAFYVAVTIILLPRLGVTMTLSLAIAGQLIFSLIMDHYGWFGVPEKNINAARVLGVLFVFAGVLLIRKY